MSYNPDTVRRERVAAAWKQRFQRGPGFRTTPTGTRLYGDGQQRSGSSIAKNSCEPHTEMDTSATLSGRPRSAQNQADITYSSTASANQHGSEHLSAGSASPRATTTGQSHAAAEKLTDATAQSLNPAYPVQSPKSLEEISLADRYLVKDLATAVIRLFPFTPLSETERTRTILAFTHALSYIDHDTVPDWWDGVTVRDSETSDEEHTGEEDSVDEM